MNIVLMGYMGCGKSSIGRQLASKLDKAYMDLDDYIEEHEKRTIKEIFRDKGEIYFRKKESEYLKLCLKELKNTIISLGGGTPCFIGNLETIKSDENTISIYLQTSLEELVNRLFLEKDARPLIAHLKTKEELKDFVRKHLFERSFYYNQSDQKVITDSKTIEDVTIEIENILL